MVNYVKVRKTFQNKIFPELNYKKHTPSPTVWFLRNCGVRKTLVAVKRKTRVSQKRNEAILREMILANNCANCCFFALLVLRELSLMSTEFLLFFGWYVTLKLKCIPISGYCHVLWYKQKRIWYFWLYIFKMTSKLWDTAI